MILYSIYLQKTAIDMSMETVCILPFDRHDMNHCKCLLQCCIKCPSMVVTVLDYTIAVKNTSPTIKFHFYLLLSHCTVHGIQSF